MNEQEAKARRAELVPQLRAYGRLERVLWPIVTATAEAGFSRLKAFLSEVPPERFTSPLKVADVPRLFTTETFCKILIRQQRAGAASSVGTGNPGPGTVSPKT